MKDGKNEKIYFLIKIKSIVRKMLKQTKRFLDMHGISPLNFLSALSQTPRYISEYNAYKKASSHNFPLKLSNIMPVLSDYKESAGTIKGHYVHQDLWAAQKIYKNAPVRHVDIGSRIDGFITSLMVFRDVEVVDIRPLTSPYQNLKFLCDDATLMRNFKDGELESVSCLHAMEHFGLGRYGDPVDANAYKTFAQSLSRTIRPKGKLYISVPIGEQRLQFNAHRIFAPETIIDLFENFDLVSFSAVNDDGDFIENTSPASFTNSKFSCGLFEFTKKG
jgi:hypothetical protein